MIIVTGGSGFIGSNFIKGWLSENDESVLNIDKLSYAASRNNLKDIVSDPRYFFSKGDICNKDFLKHQIKKYNPRAIIHFAAESHVDRSISSPKIFLDTNIIGTFNLLEVAKDYIEYTDAKDTKDFRFIHISTDEVYGSLHENEKPFTENNQFKPNSPYSASKASSDHLVRAYFKTYSLPCIITNCSNNYGPYQFPEKLIPLVINNCLNLKPIPVYGNGLQIRDWLHVEDHCKAIKLVLKKGKIGQTYNIGGKNEKLNIDVINTICEILDKIRPNKSVSSYKSLISHVEDRPGHDIRYAINSSKISNDLEWNPTYDFDAGIFSTIEWYLNNKNWLDGKID
jgi:dTDP-glucose 4,6-dehydratase